MQSVSEKVLLPVIILHNNIFLRISSSKSIVCARMKVRNQYYNCVHTTICLEQKTLYLNLFWFISSLTFLAMLGLPNTFSICFQLKNFMLRKNCLMIPANRLSIMMKCSKCSQKRWWMQRRWVDLHSFIELESWILGKNPNNKHKCTNLLNTELEITKPT